MSDPRTGPPGPAGPRIGVWGLLDIPEFGRLAAAEVLTRELEVRCPSATILRYAPAAAAVRNPFDMGRPIMSLGPWTPERRGELAAAVDCVVVVGDLPVEDGRYLVDGVGPERPVVWSGVEVPAPLAGADLRAALERVAVLAVRDERSADLVRESGRTGPVDVLADPSVLLRRLWDPAVLDRRIRYLRAVGAFPDAPPLVVEASAAEPEQVEGLVASLRELAGGGREIVVIETAPERDREAVAGLMRALGMGARLAAPLGLQDVAAIIARSAGVVASSPAVGAAAVSFDRPSVLLGWRDPAGRRAAAEALGDVSALVERPEEVPDAFREVARRTDRAELRRSLEAPLIRHLDAVARVAVDAGSGTVEAPDEARAALLRALRVRGQLLAAQRWQMAERVEDPRERIAELERQLAELRATKTFRYTAAVRRWYGRRLRRRGSP